MTLALVDDLLDLLTAEVLDGLSLAELNAVWSILAESYSVPSRRSLQPHQAAPDGDWWAWMFSAGRGAGKTWAMAEHFYDHAMGPPCLPGEPGGHRMAIVGPTLGDVATSCFAGPSGLRRIDGRTKMTTRLGGTFVIMPNGAEAKCVGGRTVPEADRLRAHGNTCCVWVEEAAAIRALASIWVQLGLSVRAGPSPRIMMSSTPVNKLAYRRILNDPHVVVTHARTVDNVHGNREWQQRQLDKHAGTRTGQQELEGILPDEVEGALWSGTKVDAKRINLADLRAKVPPLDGESPELWLRRALNLTVVYVGIDPATSGRGDRTGMVVVGRDNPSRRAQWLPEPFLSLHLRRPDRRPWAFVLADHTAMMVPSLVDLGEARGDDKLPWNIDGWGERAVDLARRWHANEISVEQNRLGRTARAVLRGAAQAAGRSLGRIHEVDADTSKWNRADPISGEWLHRMWMVGSLPGLEVEMTTWIPGEGDDPDVVDDDDQDAFTGSPDALDAMVWAATRALGLEKTKGNRGPTRSYVSAIEAGWSGG